MAFHANLNQYFLSADLFIWWRRHTFNFFCKRKINILTTQLSQQFDCHCPKSYKSVEFEQDAWLFMQLNQYISESRDLFIRWRRHTFKIKHVHAVGYSIKKSVILKEFFFQVWCFWREGIELRNEELFY